MTVVETFQLMFLFGTFIVGLLNLVVALIKLGNKK
ncbi:putative holin-like toxin [Pilibacter termitis]